jgi:general secretion pathway protein B
MSFILDALKKSESERQRQIGPSLADVPVRRARADRPWWAVAVAGLLVVNLGVLLVVLTRDGADTTPQSQAPQPAPVAAQPTVVQQQTYAQPQPAARQAPAPANPAVHSLAEAAGTDAMTLPNDAPYDPALAGAAAVPDGPPVVKPITPPSVTPLPNEPTFAARGRSGAGVNDEVLPTHGSLIASGTNLPEMRLDIHVYSANPKERFVFINMRKYSEGQASTEGPLIERITADGAILNQNGTRFLLPRQ